MTDLALQFALSGDLEKACANYKVAYLTAAKESGTAEARDLQTHLRADVIAARLGQGIANAWRLDVFPPGSKLSYQPAWFLHSAAATIIEAFSNGGNIGPRKAQGLAVPIPGSPAYDLKLKRGSNRVAETIRRFGPLARVVTKKGTIMLVATLRAGGAAGIRPLSQRSTKDGHRFSSIKANTARVEVPMFWIVRQVRLEKRLNWQTIGHAAESRFAGRVEGRLRIRFDEAGAKGVTGSVAGGFD